MDNEHEIVEEVKLSGNAKLHRFINACGTEYSAIYENDYEIFSCERSREDAMIQCYNDMEKMQ